MWPFKARSGNTPATAAAISPLRSDEYEDVLKRISSLKADVHELQSAQEKQRERLVSLAGKLYATAATEKDKEEAKGSKSTEPVYI